MEVKVHRAVNATFGADVSRVYGRQVNLRLVTTADASYINALRQNPEYNQHVSPVIGTVADQTAWIESYKKREASGKELYYVVERKDSMPCGLVRLYNVTRDRFTWGSWILDRNKPSKAALESAVLSFGIGFVKLGIQHADIDVRMGNAKAIAFYRRFGMKEVRQDCRNLYFEYSRDQYLDGFPSFLASIKGNAKV